MSHKGPSYTDGTQFDSVKNSYAEMALRQSEKKLQKETDSKRQGFFEDVKEKYRIWSEMRKSTDEADIPGKRKTLGDTLQRLALSFIEKRFRNFLNRFCRLEDKSL